MNIGLSLAAGLLGGFLSHYISPRLVHAQAEPVPTNEIRAQGFILVNADGTPAGIFGFEKGRANVVLLNSAGKVVWRATGLVSNLGPDSTLQNPNISPK
jgi:hypothetical protein